MAGGVQRTPALSDGAARIVIEIRNEQPIDLLEFTASLTGLAREHEATLREARPELPVDETRLLIVDVRKGSIILELLPVLAPFISAAEFTNTAVAFVENFAKAIGHLKLPGGRLPDAKTQRLKNMIDAVLALSRDPGGEMSISARLRDGDTLQELVVRREEARQVVENASAQRKEIEQTQDVVYEKVLMRLHQSSVDALRVGKRTSEKGIVERIDLVPRTLVYVSDHAGRVIKGEILKPEGNPFQKGFIVDLDVETVGGRPRVYRILAVYEVIDLEEE